MTTAELLAGNISRTQGMIEKMVEDFSDEQMFFRPAKSANHATWQLGHLAKSTWGMVSGCDPTIHSPLSDETRFNKETAGVDDVAQFPDKKEILKMFGDAMQAAAAWAGKLSDADLAKPGPERLKNFAPTLAHVALLLSTHPTMHMGQFSVMRRALGKPVLF
jgi:hypothetical protein